MVSSSGTQIVGRGSKEHFSGTDFMTRRLAAESFSSPAVRDSMVVSESVIRMIPAPFTSRVWGLQPKRMTLVPVPCRMATPDRSVRCCRSLPAKGNEKRGLRNGGVFVCCFSFLANSSALSKLPQGRAFQLYGPFFQEDSLESPIPDLNGVGRRDLSYN